MVAALLSLVLSTAPPVVSLASAEGGLVAYDSLGKQSLRFAGQQADAISLSSTGKWASLITEGKIRVLAMKPEAKPRELEPTGVLDARWAPRGSFLAMRTRAALLVYQATTPSEPLLEICKDAQAFAWSPDGSRLVVAQPSPRGGQLRLYRIGESRSRMVLEGREATRLAWSPDGRRLAFLKPVTGGRFEVVVGRLGTDNWKLIESTAAAELSWSPDSKRLAVRTPSQLSVWSLSGEKPVVARQPVQPKDHVQWVKSDRLELFDGATRWRLDAAIASRQKIAQLAPAPQGAYARSGEIELDGSLLASDPLRGVPNPPSGRLQLVGNAVDFDPIENELSLSVESSRDASGSERHYAQPLQVALVLGPVSRFFGEATGGLQAQEVPLEQPGVFQVQGPLTEGKKLNLDWVSLPGDQTDPFIPESGFPKPTGLVPEYDRVVRDRIVVPMVYPLLGTHQVRDTFLASRGGGTRRHLGQDLMAEKMRPMVATFSGTVTFGRNRGNAGHTVTLRHPSGWTAQYYHVNNDTPATNDGLGGDFYAFAPGLVDGSRVVAGQLLGWVGNSGNAETTAPHIHFELWYSTERIVINAHPSLMKARRLTAPVYPVPVPFLAPPPGQMRIDAVLHQIDAGDSRMTVQRIATLRPNGSPQVSLKPQLETLFWSTNTKLRHRQHDGITLSAQDLRPGQLASLMVTPEKPTDTLLACIEAR